MPIPRSIFDAKSWTLPHFVCHCFVSSRAASEAFGGSTREQEQTLLSVNIRFTFLHSRVALGSNGVDQDTPGPADRLCCYSKYLIPLLCVKVLRTGTISIPRNSSLAFDEISLKVRTHGER